MLISVSIQGVEARIQYPYHEIKTVHFSSVFTSFRLRSGLPRRKKMKHWTEAVPAHPRTRCALQMWTILQIQCERPRLLILIFIPLCGLNCNVNCNCESSANAFHENLKTREWLVTGVVICQSCNSPRIHTHTHTLSLSFSLFLPSRPSLYSMCFMRAIGCQSRDRLRMRCLLSCWASFFEHSGMISASGAPVSRCVAWHHMLSK